jgi:hypothetical protein
MVNLLEPTPPPTHIFRPVTPTTSHQIHHHHAQQSASPFYSWSDEGESELWVIHSRIQIVQQYTYNGLNPFLLEDPIHLTESHCRAQFVIKKEKNFLLACFGMLITNPHCRYPVANPVEFFSIHPGNQPTVAIQ